MAGRGERVTDETNKESGLEQGLGGVGGKGSMGRRRDKQREVRLEKDGSLLHVHVHVRVVHVVLCDNSSCCFLAMLFHGKGGMPSIFNLFEYHSKRVMKREKALYLSSGHVFTCHAYRT